MTCSAQQSSKPAQTALAAAALAAAVSFGAVDAAQADISGLTPCSESKGFAKRQKAEVKTLTKRLKNVRVLTDVLTVFCHLHCQRVSLLPQYEADSAPALALNAQIDRTEKRFATYAKQGLLCGADGLPHLISEPGLALRYGHAGETLVSSIRCAQLCHSCSDSYCTCLVWRIVLLTLVWLKLGY